MANIEQLYQANDARPKTSVNSGAVTANKGTFLKLHTASILLATAAALLAGCRQKQQPQTTERPQVTAAQPASESTQASTSIRGSDSVAARPSGPIRFTDITAQAGIHFRHHSGAFGKKYLPETMGSGVCVLDYDDDRWQDILFVNSMDWPGHKTTKSYPALYHNNQDGTFTDVTGEAGLAREMYGMGCAVGDYDNDGHDDIYITALDGNHLFRNLGNGKFADVTV